MLVGSNSGDEYSLWRLQLPGGSLRKIIASDLLKDGVGLDVSPDGKWIALIEGRGDVILIGATDGSVVHTLTAPPREVLRPIGGEVTWSPDGKKLRFTWNHRYWEIASDGSGLRPLDQDWHPESWECCGHWTADAKSFVFVSSDTSVGSTLPVGQLWILNERQTLFHTARSKPVQLTYGPMYWSNLEPGKESGKLFAEGMVLRGELVRFDPSSREFRSMWNDIPAEFVEYSPDRNSVVYVTFPDGVMWRAGFNGSNRVQLTSSSAYPVNPHWSPDRTRILFFAGSYANSKDAYVVPAQGGHSEKIPAKTEINDPTWSPDGKRILYATTGLEQMTQSEIEIMDLGTHQTTTVPGSAGRWSPRWSPDGKFIAALDATWSLSIFDFKTQKWTMLEKGVCSFPTWSRDSQFIYFGWTLTSVGIYRVSLKGGKPEKVADLTGISSTGALFNWFGLDPDGMPLLLRDAGSDEIYSLTLTQD
jgi:Tol biopolymer transport system component